MRKKEYIRRINQAGRIPYGMLSGREIDECLVRETIVLLRKIVREKGQTIKRFPELCAAGIGWAQKCYACGSQANLSITLPTTVEELQHEGARETLLCVAGDLETLYN